VWGGRFRDLLADLPDGTRQLDYRVFHEIDELHVPAPSGDARG
jgi:hypothetical protein